MKTNFIPIVPDVTLLGVYAMKKLSNPYPNEHAIRYLTPVKNAKYRRQNNKFGEGIDAIWMIKNGKSHLQAIRVQAIMYGKAAVKEIAKHFGKPLKIEYAVGGARPNPVRPSKYAEKYSFGYGQPYLPEVKRLYAAMKHLIKERTGTTITNAELTQLYGGDTQRMLRDANIILKRMGKKRINPPKLNKVEKLYMQTLNKHPEYWETGYKDPADTADYVYDRMNKRGLNATQKYDLYEMIYAGLT